MVSRRRTVTIELLVDDDDKRKLDGVGDTAEQTGSKFGAMGEAAKLAAGLFAADQIKDFAVELLNIATTAEATTRRVETVFGENADFIREWSDEWNERFGVSTSALEAWAAGVGDLLVPLGFTREEAASLSTDVLTAANALSEFAGVPVEQAVDAVTAALLGEREQLKSLGIQIDAEQLKAESLTGTFGDLTSETDAQKEALDTLTLIYEKGKDALSAYEDGADTLTAQQKELTAAWADAKLTLAEELTPALSEAIGFVVDMKNAAGGDTDSAKSAFQSFADSVLSVNDKLSIFAPAIQGTQTGIDLAADSTRTFTKDQDSAKQSVDSMTDAIIRQRLAVEGYGKELDKIPGKWKAIADAGSFPTTPGFGFLPEDIEAGIEDLVDQGSTLPPGVN